MSEQSGTARIDRGDAVNLAHNLKQRPGRALASITPKGLNTLADAILLMDDGIRTLEREAADLRGQLAEARLELLVISESNKQLGRLVEDKDRDRIFFRDKAESAERGAAENERDARRYRRLRKSVYLAGDGYRINAVFPTKTEYAYNLPKAKLLEDFEAAIDTALASESGGKEG